MFKPKFTAHSPWRVRQIKDSELRLQRKKIKKKTLNRVKINFNYDKIEFWYRLVKKAQQKRTKNLVEKREW